MMLEAIIPVTEDALMIDRGWKFYPALKLALCFGAGITAAHAFSPTTPQLLLILYGALCWLALAIRRDGVRLVLPIIVITISAGCLAYTLRAGSMVSGLEGEMLRDIELAGRVTGEPVFRNGRIELLVEPDVMIFRSSAVKPRTRVLLRVYDTSGFNPAMLPRHGDRITVAGSLRVPEGPANPGEFNQAAYLRSRGIELMMTVNRASSFQIIRHDDLTWLEHLVLPVRRAARQFCDHHVGGEEGDILRALLLGEREYIDAETRDAFAYTGTVHVLAVSGFNVGMIALALFVLVSWIGSRWWQFLLFVPMLALYTIVAGGEASIVRATVMASAFMLARAAGRIARPLNTLGAAALAILVIAPGQLFDIGFQLSFASVAGIIMLYVPAWEWMCNRVPFIRKHAPVRWTAGMLLLSFCAQLFTLPLVLHHFGFLSFISLLANLPVIPLTSVALGAGAAGTCVGLLWEGLAGWFGGAVHASLVVAVWCVRWGAGISWGATETGTVGVAGAAMLVVMAMWLALSRRGGQVLFRGTSFIMAAFCLVLLGRMLDPLRQAGTEYLCLLKGRDGIVAASVRNGVVRLYAAGRAADSISLRFTGDALRRRFGADTAMALPLNSAGSYRNGNELMMMGDSPREAVPAGLPVILSSTRRRPLGMVKLFGEKFLQIPLRAELEKAIVLRYDGTWREVVDW